MKIFPFWGTAPFFIQSSVFQWDGGSRDLLFYLIHSCIWWCSLTVSHCFSISLGSSSLWDPGPLITGESRTCRSSDHVFWRAGDHVLWCAGEQERGCYDWLSGHVLWRAGNDVISVVSDWSLYILGALSMRWAVDWNIPWCVFKWSRFPSLYSICMGRLRLKTIFFFFGVAVLGWGRVFFQYS